MSLRKSARDLKSEQIRRLEIEANSRKNATDGLDERVSSLETAITDIDTNTDETFLGGVIRINPKIISENLTILATVNGVTAGPVAISSGYTVTVESGATWTIV